MKICVLVKEVPDAAVTKRIDPSTGRMDRSGEKNLNPYDTHAIEAAMQIKEGGAVSVDEVVAVTMGPDSALRAEARARGWQIRDFRTGRKAVRIGVRVGAPSVGVAAVLGAAAFAYVRLRRRAQRPGLLGHRPG